MNPGRTLAALLATHTAVAMAAWVHGWIVGRLLARRSQEIDELFETTSDDGDFLDLAEPAPPYDWATRLDSGVGDPPSSWPAVITFTPNVRLS
jgi:hypothetical protein